MKPLVTIITPAYNCSKYIRATIRSVARQTYKPIEHIIIDDGSTDDTYQKAKSIIPNARSCHIISQDNKGEQETVNQGLRMVTGKYFMITNADDPLLPSAVSKLVAFMEAHPDILVAYPDWIAINEDGSTRHKVTSREYDFKYMVAHHTCLPSVGSMFRSSVIQTVGLRDTGFRWLGDFDYWLRIGLLGKMARVPETLACWRNRDGQASKDKSDTRAAEHIRIIDKLFGEFVSGEARAWSYLVAAAVCGNRFKVIGYSLKALRLCPKMLFKFEFYHAMWRYANYILRR